MIRDEKRFAVERLVTNGSSTPPIPAASSESSPTGGTSPLPFTATSSKASLEELINKGQIVLDTYDASNLIQGLLLI
ncbi:uncharacterized protein OCT59_010177 [Rhizophagus irregularis]|uniref:Uncharacterized protein n=1 Tax=Rhizophagus irregularis (strain DAOM 197198w) TaxID=1432141 RepID=A0A015JLF7_RHIIW|nr:hypothetical protein RirG_108680 [Rhizophagus irregularis DAOM 197198w]UZO18869.1 hypothetical protein OCT59_010177 [Rhizophagus irregularis]GET54430.1 hypothetical protein RIR_jg4020.t1 [Rhizophagus irregularis DAOM 181602=DAOM 197198]